MSRYHYLLYVNPRGKHIAHCLDFDIVASADSRDESLRRLGILVEVHTKKSLTRTPAPVEFWKRFNAVHQTCVADEPVGSTPTKEGAVPDEGRKREQKSYHLPR